MSFKTYIKFSIVIQEQEGHVVLVIVYLQLFPNVHRGEVEGREGEEEGKWGDAVLHQAAIGMAACCRPPPQSTGRAVAMLRGNFLPRAHPKLVARICLI